MSKPAKAVVIPTSFLEVPYVTMLSRNHLESFHKIIGCSCIDLVRLDEKDDYSAIDMIVDDEGLINQSPINAYFYRAYNKGLCDAPIAGIGVITKTDSEGETVDVDIEDLISLLKEYGFSDRELESLK